MSVRVEVAEKHHIVIVLESVRKTQTVVDPGPFLFVFLLLVIINHVYLFSRNVRSVELVPAVPNIEAAPMPPNLSLKEFFLRKSANLHAFVKERVALDEINDVNVDGLPFLAAHAGEVKPLGQIMRVSVVLQSERILILTLSNGLLQITTLESRVEEHNRL